MSVSAEKILTIARGEVGTAASDVKRCKYNTWYYGAEVSGTGYDWCEVFVQWVFCKAGASSLLYTKTANCGYAAKAFRDKGRLVTSGFKKGDVVFFHWNSERSELVPGTYVSHHVGIIESVNSDGTLTTIEGNTGSSSNGAVLRQRRPLSVVSCAGRPAYDGKPDGSQATPSVSCRVRTKGRWLPEVADLSDFAGIKGSPITDVAIRASSGTVRYRVHVLGGNWLPYVTGCDISDSRNGYAGNGKPVDAVEVIYGTPKAYAAAHGYLRAKYRLSPTGGGYFPWQYDNERSASQDGYAGEFGKAADRLQLCLSK